MAPFDPYHIWLGIPPEEQPPSHYRLLGIPELESDADVIDTAAERQTVFLRTFQAGDQADLAEQLLNEVSAARICLLDGKAKARYDKRLKAELDSAAGSAALANISLAAGSGSQRDRGRRSGSSAPPAWYQTPWAAAAASAVVMLLLILLFGSGGTDTKKPGKKTPQGNPQQLSDLKTKQNLIDTGAREDTSKHQFISQPTLSWKAHDQNIFRMLFSPDGRWLATVSKDNTAKVWDVSSGKKVHTLKGHNWEVVGADFSPDSQLLATACRSGRVKLWDVASGREVRSLVAHGGDAREVSFNPVGDQFSTTGHDNLVKNWDTATGQKIMTLRGHTGWGLRSKWNPKGTRIASGSMDKTVKIWDASTGEEIVSLSGHPNYVSDVLWSPDGTKLASTSNDTVRVWSVSNGKELYVLRGCLNPCWSPDSRKLVCYGVDASVTVTDGESGKPLQTLTGHVGTAGSATYSPDGTKIASGSSDNTVWIWDAKTGTPIYTFWGHRSPPKFIRFSPDGKQIVSCGSDGTIKVWDLRAIENTSSSTAKSLPESLQQGLVAYYPFNGNAKDESGNGHDGRVFGAQLGTDRFGNLQSAYHFNGIDSYVRVEDTTSLRLSGTGYTFSLWCNLDEPRHQLLDALVFKRTRGTRSGYAFGLAGADSGKEHDLPPGVLRIMHSGGGDPECHSLSKIPNSGWVNVALVFESEMGAFRMFLNGGELPNDGVRCPTPNPNTNAPLFFGYDSSGSPYWYHGSLDDIRIYDRALSEAEVKALYEFEKP